METVKRLFDSHGYAIIPNLFDEDQIDSVRHQMYDILQIRNSEDLLKPGLEGFKEAANQCQYLVSLYNLACSQKVQTVLKKLGLEAPAVNTRPLVSFSHKNLASHDSYWRVPAHQDWPSTQGSLNGVTLWTPFFNVTKEMGPLQVIPGSHLLGPLDHVIDHVPILKQEFSGFIDIPLNVGDAVIFSWFLIHRSGINTSNKIRMSTHWRYDDALEATFIARDFPHHRIDMKKEGISYIPTENDVRKVFNALPDNNK